jgi:hypothetical protein
MMNHRVTLLAVVGFVAGAMPALAGTVYKVTSQDGDKTVTYEVRFGGGKAVDFFTAFDPETKKFIYLQWKRNGEKPTPVMQVWDHRTGETILLYRFPDAKNPLPVIPSIDAMKVCPLTGDKKFKAKPYAAID